MRIEGQFDDRITSERALLLRYLRNNEELPTEVSQLGNATIPNPRTQEELGAYRELSARKSVTADFDVIEEYYKTLGKSVPTFLEAGPRKKLFHDPHKVR